MAPGRTAAYAPATTSSSRESIMMHQGRRVVLWPAQRRPLIRGTENPDADANFYSNFWLPAELAKLPLFSLLTVKACWPGVHRRAMCASCPCLGLRPPTRCSAGVKAPKSALSDLVVGQLICEFSGHESSDLLCVGCSGAFRKNDDKRLPADAIVHSKLLELMNTMMMRMMCTYIYL